MAATSSIFENLPLLHLLRRPLVSIALLALVACGGGDLTLPNEGQPANVSVVSGDGQTGTILEPLPDSLVVQVTDRFGNPVPGVEVTWAAEGGGDVQPATAVTGSDGRAATQRILKSPGSLNAWEAYHRGLWHMYRFNGDDNARG